MIRENWPLQNGLLIPYHCVNSYTGRCNWCKRGKRSKFYSQGCYSNAPKVGVGESWNWKRPALCTSDSSCYLRLGPHSSLCPLGVIQQSQVLCQAGLLTLFLSVNNNCWLELVSMELELSPVTGHSYIQCESWELVRRLINRCFHFNALVVAGVRLTTVTSTPPSPPPHTHTLLQRFKGQVYRAQPQRKLALSLGIKKNSLWNVLLGAERDCLSIKQQRSNHRGGGWGTLLAGLQISLLSWRTNLNVPSYMYGKINSGYSKQVLI